jgi:hypothetical protein
MGILLLVLVVVLGLVLVLMHVAPHALIAVFS